MTDKNQPLDALNDIRNMMDRSSRFISLSGWSGVAAGSCALVGAWFAHGEIAKGIAAHSSLRKHMNRAYETEGIDLSTYIGSSKLIAIAAFTLLAAIASAFLFTWLRTRKTGVPLWGTTSRRLVFAIALPLVVGGIYMLKLMEAGTFGLIAPGCLLFYGLALVNASRHTLGEIKWLGYGQIITGIINLWYTGYGLYFWAFGFGILHIVYGLAMWWTHERKSNLH